MFERSTSQRLTFVADLLADPRPFDSLRAANTVLCCVFLGAAAVLVKVGLWMANDILAFRRRFTAPVRYLLTVVMIVVLALVAIPLLPVMFGAALLGNAKVPD